MKLALTGATGFVGSATLDHAIESGHTVAALTRKAQLNREGVDWIEGTLSDQQSLEALSEGSDALIHIAGLTNTPDPAEFEAANVTGTANVIEAAKKHGVTRLVFVSSLSAREPELSQYGASKARAEELVQASGLDWTIVRPPAVYGPRDSDMFELVNCLSSSNILGTPTFAPYFPSERTPGSSWCRGLFASQSDSAKAR